jgi:hypothetical protein
MLIAKGFADRQRQCLSPKALLVAKGFACRQRLTMP